MSDTTAFLLLAGWALLCALFVQTYLPPFARWLTQPLRDWHERRTQSYTEWARAGRPRDPDWRSKPDRYSVH